jgi:hypothetical protein
MPLTWSERELPSNLVELTAEMMMKGVLRAVEGHDGHDRQPEMEWFLTSAMAMPREWPMRWSGPWASLRAKEKCAQDRNHV